MMLVLVRSIPVDIVADEMKNSLQTLERRNDGLSCANNSNVGSRD